LGTLVSQPIFSSQLSGHTYSPFITIPTFVWQPVAQPVVTSSFKVNIYSFERQSESPDYLALLAS
jgi:hypothetical protein